jgi:NAD-dependent SIR2 family protein deacetylase
LIDRAQAQACLEDFFSRHERVMVITGAGCSTASGIGDYRDAEGEWKRAAPVQMQDFVSSNAVRQRYWARSMHGWRSFSKAEPNAAHVALAELERRGAIHGLITQNVDGLHQRAGQRAVIELHGSLQWVVCLSCSKRTSRAELQTWLEAANEFVLRASASLAPDGDADLVVDDLTSFQVPNCDDCGGILKPDVVFYGDAVPKLRVERAYAQVDAAAALLVVGSSLMVYSSYRFLKRAHQRGMPMAAVNRGRTRADDWFEFKVDDDCATVLPQLVDSHVALTRGRV